MTSVVVTGAKGRMGTLVRAAVEEADDLSLALALDAADVAALDAAAPGADVVVDFSAPGALPHLEAYVRRTGTALVSGTTGLSEAELARVRSLGEVAPVVWSGNYSLGVAVLRRVAAEAARALGGWDAEIVETHHRRKADAPSGTALMLRDAVDPDHRCEVVCGREGVVGPRGAREIGIHSVRGGTVAGTHELHLFGDDEELVLTHRASSRRIFVEGALAAARRVARMPAGFYDFDQLVFGD